MTFECQRCKSEVSELSFCKLCGNLVCESCLDQYAGVCVDCAKELAKGTQPGEPEEEVDEGIVDYEDEERKLLEEALDWYNSLDTEDEYWSGSLDPEDEDYEENLDESDIVELYLQEHYASSEDQDYPEGQTDDLEVDECGNCGRPMFAGESHADCISCGRTLCLECEGEECVYCRKERDSHTDEVPT